MYALSGSLHSYALPFSVKFYPVSLFRGCEGKAFNCFPLLVVGYVAPFAQ